MYTLKSIKLIFLVGIMLLLAACNDTRDFVLEPLEQGPVQGDQSEVQGKLDEGMPLTVLEAAKTFMSALKDGDMNALAD